MQIKVKRVLFRVGEDSYAVTLPKAWISYKHLKHGDSVKIIVNEEIIIRAEAAERAAEAKG